jgi:tetratricopeptide (TPR) repeat protein
MLPNISPWVASVGIAALVSFVQTNALAKTSVEIAQTARAITVLITEPENVGSGVILQQQGDIYTVLTSAHVVQNQADYKITTPDDRQYQIVNSSIRRAPGNIDLAVVKFRSTAKYDTAKLGNCTALQSGMDLYISGFPGTSKAITEPIFVFREGKVSANSSKIFDAGYSLVYSNNTLPGMSGGAVLNSDGELVAIHGRGDRDDNGVKNGFNLGIPIERFGTVASSMGIDLGGHVAPMPKHTAPKADDFIAAAGQKDRQRDYRGSLADLDRAIQLNPNLASAYNNRGALKANQLQDIQGGLDDYNRAIQLDPNLTSAYNNRGALKADKLQDIQGALDDYSRAIQLDPNVASTYNNRGFIKAEKLQDPRGGLADFDRAIQIDPNLASAYNNRGNLKADRFQDARGGLDDYNRAIQLDPKLVVTYNNRGNLKADKLQDIQGGLADFDRAIELDPSLAITYLWRGMLKYDRLKERSGAIADIQQAANLYQQQGRPKQYQWAIEYLKKIEGK